MSRGTTGGVGVFIFRIIGKVVSGGVMKIYPNKKRLEEKVADTVAIEIIRTTWWVKGGFFCPLIRESVFCISQGA